jgi:hypothetical protein
MGLLFGGNGVVNAARKTHKRRVRTAKRRRGRSANSARAQLPGPRTGARPLLDRFSTSRVFRLGGCGFLVSEEKIIVDIAKDLRIGAGIACSECGARPFPELGPAGTRQTFDLRKVRGQWRCELHQPPPLKKKQDDREKDFSFERVETLKDLFDDKVAQVDEGGRDEALELIADIQAIVARLKPSTALAGEQVSP